MPCCVSRRGFDIAPEFGFLRKQIQFNPDNCATITFFAIKDDMHRKGFAINLSPAAELSVDPVQCLRCYLDRTKDPDISDQECGNMPIFRSLMSPSDGVGASTVAKILREILRSAGVADDYTARGFRQPVQLLQLGQGVIPMQHVRMGVGPPGRYFMIIVFTPGFLQ